MILNIHRTLQEALTHNLIWDWHWLWLWKKSLILNTLLFCPLPLNPFCSSEIEIPWQELFRWLGYLGGLQNITISSAELMCYACNDSNALRRYAFLQWRIKRMLIFAHLSRNGHQMMNQQLNIGYLNFQSQVSILSTMLIWSTLRNTMIYGLICAQMCLLV